LTAVQHRSAQEAFEALRDERFLPFDQVDEDAARAELDLLVVQVENAYTLPSILR